MHAWPMRSAARMLQALALAPAAPPAAAWVPCGLALAWELGPSFEPAALPTGQTRTSKLFSRRSTDSWNSCMRVASAMRRLCGVEVVQGGGVEQSLHAAQLRRQRHRRSHRHATGIGMQRRLCGQASRSWRAGPDLLLLLQIRPQPRKLL